MHNLLPYAFSIGVSPFNGLLNQVGTNPSCNGWIILKKHMLQKCFVRTNNLCFRVYE
jgi:hypothetical protein